MTNKEVLRQNIGLILGLGAIALIRPIMKITGMIHLLVNEQFGSILMTILISLVWLIIVVRKKSHHPIQILVFAGISYALFATILSAILSPTLTGQLQGPLTNPLALISIVVTNTIWGLIIGVIAAAIMKKNDYHHDFLYTNNRYLSTLFLLSFVLSMCIDNGMINN